MLQISFSRSEHPSALKHRITHLLQGVIAKAEYIHTWTDLGFSAEEVTRGIQSACGSVFAAEPDLTEFDTIVGDGDCGHTFASGAKGSVWIPHLCIEILNLS